MLDWCRYAPPASKEHWNPGASAFELARDWLSGSGEERVCELLERKGLGTIEVKRAVAEAQTSFDPYAGGRRNHDLLLEARSAAGPLVISVEGKVNEPFGETLKGYHRAAMKIRAQQEATNRPERLDLLTQIVLGTTLAKDVETGSLRYQLLSGVAGTLAAAHRVDATYGIFVVHQFLSSRSKKAAQARNKSDLRGFLEAAFGLEAAKAAQGAQWLLGPLRMTGSGADWASHGFWIGQLTSRAPRPEPPPEEWDCA